MALKLVMLGTGEFALPTFRGLYQTPHQVVGLLTQPHRTGRGHHHHSNPMKDTALEHNTPVFQPENANTPAALDMLKSLDADLYVVAAYGQILSAELLGIPRLGAINLHASLLPKYRGAAPIQYAILHGETETGITIFQIEPKLDAGPIFGVAKTPIGPKETSGELETRLSEIAVPLTMRVLDELESGTAQKIKQTSDGLTRAPRMKKSFGTIDWRKSADEIGWHVRAMQPWPKSFAFLEQPGKQPLRLIVLDVELAEADPTVDVALVAEPGVVVEADDNRLVVQTGSGAVSVTRLQPEGKRPMDVSDFLCGHPVKVGDRMTLSDGGN